MDLISNLLQGVRVETPLLTQMRIGGNLTVDMEKGAGAPFQFIVSGRVGLLVGAEAYQLSAGDIALLPNWHRYSLRFGTGSRPRTIRNLVESLNLPRWTETHGLDSALSIEIGSSPTRAHIMSGIVGIRPQEVSLLTAAFPAVIIFRHHDPILEPTIQATMSLMARELEKSEPGFAAAAARSLELLFVQALREWFLRSEHPPGLARGIGHPQIKRALEAIYADPGGAWSVNRLARSAGQSRSGFAATFLAVTGETPFAHLRRVRIDRAAYLLRTGAKSISEIASLLGYASASSFRRAFFEQMGTSASTYRRAKRQADAERLAGA